MRRILDVLGLSALGVGFAGWVIHFWDDRTGSIAGAIACVMIGVYALAQGFVEWLDRQWKR